MLLSIDGNPQEGYWVNLGPGKLRLGPVCPTSKQAAGMLGFYGRNCGDSCQIIVPPEERQPSLLTRARRRLL